MIGSELLDDPRADPIAVGRELRDIARLNAWFGGTGAVVRELEPCFEQNERETGSGKRETWTLLDIGTGAGDIPRAAVAAAARYGITLSPIGVEVIPAAARLARSSGVAAAVVQQRLAVRHGASRDQAEEDRVISTRRLRLLLAFDAGEDAFEHRQTEL